MVRVDGTTQLVAPGTSRWSELQFWLAVAGCAALLASSVTTSSLWIDEGFIAWVVGHGTLGSVLDALRGPLPSAADLQYPLYDFWILGWTHIFGYSEYALRSANIPFAFLYVVALALGSRLLFARSFAWVPFAFVPFMWFYVNEARSYCMLAALSAVCVAAMAAYAFGTIAMSKRAPWLALPALLLAWLTNILAVLVIPGLLVIALLGRNCSAKAHWSAWRVPLLLCALPFAATGVYYASTLVGGSGVAEVANNQRRVSPLGGAAQILYEQFGFDGLGPPRNALRAVWTDLNWLHYAPWLLFGVACLSIALLLLIKKDPDKRGIMLSLAWAGSYLAAIVISTFLHARFLGRHLAAVEPLFAFAGMALLRSPVALVAVAIVFAASDARLSLLSQYWKDDYRGAVQSLCARNAVRPGTIYWAADTYTAQYYGLDLQNSGLAPIHLRPTCASGSFVGNLDPHHAEALVRSHASTRRPIYLALSKPDLFDTRGGWATTIALHAIKPIETYRTFDIYELLPPTPQDRSRKSGA